MKQDQSEEKGLVLFIGKLIADTWLKSKVLDEAYKNGFTVAAVSPPGYGKSGKLTNSKIRNKSETISSSSFLFWLVNNCLKFETRKIVVVTHSNSITQKYVIPLIMSYPIAGIVFFNTNMGIKWFNAKNPIINDHLYYQPINFNDTIVRYIGDREPLVVSSNTIENQFESSKSNNIDKMSSKNEKKVHISNQISVTNTKRPISSKNQSKTTTTTTKTTTTTIYTSTSSSADVTNSDTSNEETNTEDSESSELELEQEEMQHEETNKDTNSGDSTIMDGLNSFSESLTKKDSDETLNEKESSIDKINKETKPLNTTTFTTTKKPTVTTTTTTTRKPVGTNTTTTKKPIGTATTTKKPTMTTNTTTTKKPIGMTNTTMKPTATTTTKKPTVATTTTRKPTAATTTKKPTATTTTKKPTVATTTTKKPTATTTTKKPTVATTTTKKPIIITTTTTKRTTIVTTKSPVKTVKTTKSVSMKNMQNQQQYLHAQKLMNKRFLISKNTYLDKNYDKGVSNITKVMNHCIAPNVTYKYDQRWYITEQNKMGPFGWFDGKYTIPGWRTMQMAYESFDFDNFDSKRLSNGTYLLTLDYFIPLIETLNEILPLIAQRIAFSNIINSNNTGINNSNNQKLISENIQEAPTTWNSNRQNAYLKYRANYELIPAQEIYCTN
ncbi:Alpha/Beta hydrolase fold containing protein [Cryptosporidium tyzzeri]|nr:Alpha/Beta hydrolase fold containing protein [Cryptosporidium tyzzeri]